MTNTKKLYFLDENIFEKISEILKSYNLNETLDELADMDDESKSLILITLKLVENFINNLITEKDLILDLKNQLKISQQSAENLCKDIKEKIIPLAEEVIIEPKDKNIDKEKEPANITQGHQKDWDKIF